jgi:hypothetical protein
LYIDGEMSGRINDVFTGWFIEKSLEGYTRKSKRVFIKVNEN